MKVFFSFFLFWIFISLSLTAQIKDSIYTLPTDSNTQPLISKNIYGALLDSNCFLFVKGKPQALAISLKKNQDSDLFFYIIASLFLFLGVLRTIFSRYFTTMFRVFFNTSLRQNQLTDQLEQAALPSLLFNFFFSLSMGLYIYFLYEYYNPERIKNNLTYLGLCIVAVILCYVVKYVMILFIGWLTNHKSEARIYIFSIFLLNKIIGIFLLPFTLLIAFGSNKMVEYACIFSVLLLLILLLSRFIRSFGLLQNKLKLSGIHFLIYILSLEILPLMLIYKSVIIFFVINS